METLELMLKTVMENPNDADVYGAAYDAGQDAGLKPLTARKRVNAARRTGRVRQAQDVIDGNATQRTRCRVAAGVAGNPPVIVVAGKAAPVSRGETAYSTFKNGGRCQYPGSARKAGYKTVYHASTLEVIVGAEWVLGK